MKTFATLVLVTAAAFAAELKTTLVTTTETEKEPVIAVAKVD